MDGQLLIPALFLKPHTEQDHHRLGDSALSGDPVPHGPGRNAQSGGGPQLGQPESLQSGAQLTGGHGHGATKIGTTCPCLADRHIVPTLRTWPVVRSRCRGEAFREPSSCSRSSTTSFVSWARARSRVTTRFGRSQRRAGECGSPWRRSGLAPMGYGRGPDFVACPHSAPQSSGLSASLPPRSGAPSSSCCAGPGGPYGRSSDWRTRCGRSGRNSQLDPA